MDALSDLSPGGARMVGSRSVYFPDLDWNLLVFGHNFMKYFDKTNHENLHQYSGKTSWLKTAQCLSKLTCASSTLPCVSSSGHHIGCIFDSVIF